MCLFNILWCCFSALSSQTNGNWKAFVYTTDDSLKSQLPRVIGSSDARVSVLSRNVSCSTSWLAVVVHLDSFLLLFPQASKKDFTKLTERQAMELVLLQKECKWVTVTSGDTVYGSEVVHRVLNAESKSTTVEQLTPASSSVSPTLSQADLILAPLDSKSFADKGEHAYFMNRCIGAICFYTFLHQCCTYRLSTSK